MAILAGQGFRVEGGVMREVKTGRPLALELLVQTREQERIALHYQRSLHSIGIELAVRPVDPDDVAWYEGSLFGDDAAVDEACTARAIVYNVFGLASLIGSHIKRYAAGDSVPREVIVDFATLTLLA